MGEIDRALGLKVGENKKGVTQGENRGGGQERANV